MPSKGLEKNLFVHLGLVFGNPFVIDNVLHIKSSCTGIANSKGSQTSGLSFKRRQKGSFSSIKIGELSSYGALITSRIPINR